MTDNYNNNTPNTLAALSLTGIDALPNGGGDDVVAPKAEASAEALKTVRKPDEFPFLVPIDGFPNQPSGGKSRLPGTVPNVAHLLEASGIKLSYDEIRKQVHISRNGRVLSESDLVSLANYNGMFFGWFPDFVSTIARNNARNPVADWIDYKAWDGVDRLPALCATIEVEEEFPLALRDTILRRWLLSAVAAVKKPKGFRTRGVLTLQGAQGLGKTTWIGRLVPEAMRQEWVKLDHHLDPGNKDSVLGAVCHWIVEIGELDSSFRKDVARLKGFLTNDFDKIRPPYAKSAIEMPRRTVFAATVNERNFLVDDTGNSRWLTLPVTKLDYGHDIDMQQVFAQLAAELAQGEQWWLTQSEDALLETFNAQHRTVSAIAERLKDRLVEGATGGRYMTASEVLREIGITSFGNPQCKEAGAVLRTIYGPPKRVQGRDRWQVVARSHEDAWQRSGIEIEEY